MAFHALIGAGFLAATFLVRPFLPDSNLDDVDEICGRSNATTIQEVVVYNIKHKFYNDLIIFKNSTLAQNYSEVSKSISWPFIISGAWCIIFSFGFLVLAKLPYKVTDKQRSLECTPTNSL